MSNPTPAPQLPAYLGLAALMRLSLAGTELAPLGQALIARATEDASDSSSLMDAGVIFQLLGNPEVGLQLQREALKTQRLYRLPARQPVKLRLLALMAPGDIMSSVPVECLLEDSDVELNLYYASADTSNLQDIPEHDVVFVAISESAANRPILAAWQELLATWPKPVVNDPSHVIRVARDNAYKLLHGIPGVSIPPTTRIRRPHLEYMARQATEGEAEQDGMIFPMIVRPLDSHAGHDLYKIATGAELAEKLASLPGNDFYVSPFVDYRSTDGQFRKYRVILIEGRPYACHMGISDHWMIHYLNAGMADSADKRAEEAAFMADFDSAFAQRHATALARIHQAIGLDYLGIDCAETLDGDLLIFEVDHAMVVHAMDPVDVFPYKQPAMHKLFAAFRALLQKAVDQHGQAN